MGVGVIGCGQFCDAYLSTIGSVFKSVKAVACADLDMARAQEVADRYGIRACTTDEIMAAEDVDIVLILTTAASHYQLTMQALKQGKNVYSEKPMALSLDEADDIVSLAKERGLKVAVAPDTFLTAEMRTVRKVVDDGVVGNIFGCTANFVTPGADMWHPRPDSLYKNGGGPVLDMGAYFITNLISLFGPVEQVFCYANKGFDVRQLKDHDCAVDVPTNYCGVLKFCSGAVGNINMSFDIWRSRQPRLEIYGTEGVIFAPDPNTMDGKVEVFRAKKFKDYVNATDVFQERIARVYGPSAMELLEEAEYVAPRCGNQRGAGVEDLAKAIMSGGEARNGAEFSRHVTEILNAFNVSLNTGAPYTMKTTCERPAAVEL